MLKLFPVFKSIFLKNYYNLSVCLNTINGEKISLKKTIMIGIVTMCTHLYSDAKWIPIESITTTSIDKEATQQQQEQNQSQAYSSTTSNRNTPLTTSKIVENLLKNYSEKYKEKPASELKNEQKNWFKIDTLN